MAPKNQINNVSIFFGFSIAEDNLFESAFRPIRFVIRALKRFFFSLFEGGRGLVKSSLYSFYFLIPSNFCSLSTSWALSSITL
jgi:hypothetical protein